MKQEKPMIGRLNHVAIAVPDLEAAARQYRDTLGAKVGAPQDEPDHGVTVIFIEFAEYQDRTAVSAGRKLSDQWLSGKEPFGRHSPYLL